MNRTTVLAAGALALGVLIGAALSANIAVASGGGHAASYTSRQTPAPSGKLTPWEAMATAQARTHQRPVQATFEYEDGHWQYAVMVAGHGSVSEVEIDARTGKVGDVEKANPAEEGRELQNLLTREMKK